MASWHFSFLLLFSYLGADAAVFTLVNQCGVTIWPGILAGSGKPQLLNGGLTLLPSSTATVVAPTGWSGRFWARSGCSFDESGRGKCTTGDCGGGLKCGGAAGAPPATLAEFTLNSPLDFYDVSLVDGYNIPMTIVPSVNCPKIGCTSDLNQLCPKELEVRSNGTVIACRSACLAFNKPEYCCTGAYSSPQTCKPTMYSQVFKTACPKAYSYAYDDATSTFTCQGANYTITFC